MTRSNLFLVAVVGFILTGCATQGTGNQTGEIPNQYGWNDSNCAHIMADGHCAHPTGANSQAPAIEPAIANPTNASGWNSSNCAHIMADGTCAHPL